MGKKVGGYYGVQVGRGGPKVYLTWSDTQAAVERFPGCKHKKFTTLEEALRYIGQDPSHRSSPFAGSSQSREVERDGSQLGPATPQSQRVYSNPHGPSGITSPGRSQETAIEISDSPDASIFRAHPSNVFPRDAFSNSEVIDVDSLEDEYEVSAPFVDTAPASVYPVGVSLSEEQEHILGEVLQGKSVFFTGSAGTGKSVLLREIISNLRQRNEANSASGLCDVYEPRLTTHLGPLDRSLRADRIGIAAVNIGGTTLHSWAGVKLGKEPVDVLVKDIRGKEKTTKRWTDVKTLIIDEISMCDGKFFDKLEHIARAIRGNPRPFGGIQLCVSGDFFQLPPVPDMNQGIQMQVTYAFDANTWETCVPACYMLTRVFRQRDQKFVDILNKMRVGELEHAMTKQFERLSREVIYEDALQPTQLFPLKSQVELANKGRLARLPGPTFLYEAVDTPGFDSVNNRRRTHAETEKILERLIALKQVSLRRGAQVMLIQNMKQGRLVNGSLGIVVDFLTADEAHDVHVEIAEVDKPKTSKASLGRTAVGTSFDSPVLRQSQESRASGSSQPYSHPDCDCDPEDCHCGSIRDTEDGGRRWPVVEFTNGEKLALLPVEFSVTDYIGRVEAKRVQVPLILSWALSIHKSQGQTLERVKVDLGGIFEKGQAYVALSRATNLQTLQVLNFHPSKVMAHPRVIEWSKTLKIHVNPAQPDGDEVDLMDESEW